MPNSKSDPLLDYRESSKFLVVLALYEQLHDSFCQEFGPNAAPEYFVDDFGQRIPNLTQLVHDPGKLLPIYNGWAYSPEWVAPLRLDEQRLNPLPDLEDEDATVSFLMESVPTHHRDVVELSAIEERIYERAWILGLLRSADDILDRAIEQARIELSSANEEYRVHLASAARSVASEFKELLLVSYKSEKKLRLFQLRLHWLELWNEVEIRRKRKARGRKTTQVSQIQSIIKPLDVFEAYSTIDMYLRDHDKRANRMVADFAKMVKEILAEDEQKKVPSQLFFLLKEDVARVRFDQKSMSDEERTVRLYEVLGLWYANSLYKCGSSKEELERILLKNKHASREKSQARSWHQIVRRMVNNHIQNGG